MSINNKKCKFHESEDEKIISFDPTESGYAYQKDILPSQRRRLIHYHVNNVIGDLWVKDLGWIVSEYTVSEFDCQCISVFIEPLITVTCFFSYDVLTPEE